MNWLFWAPLATASLHIFEEFVFPGGFAAWYRNFRPAIAKSITPRFLVIINAILLLVCYDAFTLRSKPIGVAVWLTVMALLGVNGCWHILATIKSRSYSPGLITGSLLYIPLTVYGYAWFLRTEQASLPTAALAFLIGASYPLLSSATHQWRARPKPA